MNYEVGVYAQTRYSQTHPLHYPPNTAVMYVSGWRAVVAAA